MRRLMIMVLLGAAASLLLTIAFQYPITGLISAAVIVSFVFGLFALVMARVRRESSG